MTEKIGTSKSSHMTSKRSRMKVRKVCPSCKCKKYSDVVNEWGCMSRICTDCKLEYALYGWQKIE